MVLSMPGVALACTQVYVGSSLTASGDTIYGREEDYGPRYVKNYGIQEATDGKTYLSDESDFTRTVDHTYRYTYVRDSLDEWGNTGFPPYSEAGVNEKGVTCSATLSTSANAQIIGSRKPKVTGVDPFPDAGLGEYNLTDVVLGEASSAREGVILLGKIIDETGNNECNQIWIGDASEVWNFQQLSGHQWLAVKVSDDVASVNPNMGNLQFKVDLDDESVCLHSAGLIDTAKKAGTDKYYEDGTFNVAASYGEDNPGTGQNTRYAQGRAYLGAALGEGAYTTNDSGQVTSVSADARQLFFTPGRSDYSLYDVQRLLAARGEGTPFDANANTALYSIGNNRGVESHLFQTRKGMSADIATIQWEALSCTEFSVYVPSYSALLTEVPDGIFDDFATADESHARASAMEDSNDDTLDYVMMDINTLAYNNRDKCGAGVAAYLKALQTAVNDQQATVDATMQATPAGEARTALANDAFDAVSHEVYAKADALRTELRTYLAGDQSKPFTPSDLADDGTLKEPLKYAAKALAPTIETQPAGATYTVGQAAAALSVSATVPDGAKLTYEWMKSTDGGKTWQTAGTSDTYVPATSAEGDVQYKVAVISDASGKTTESEAVTVSVSKPIEPEPAGSMYRLYNPNSGEHFYPADATEAGNVVKAGWRYEGVGWKAPATSDTPVYRLYNPNAGDHHYTLSAEEKDHLVSVGWSYEGIGWYSDDAKAVPVYREYNPNAVAGAHNFTTDKDEDNMLGYAGWSQEGIAWYGVE